MHDDEEDAMAEDAAYEGAFSVVPGMGEAAPVAAHTLEVLEEMNTGAANDPQMDETLDRERALAFQKGQGQAEDPQPVTAQPASPRPSTH